LAESHRDGERPEHVDGQAEPQQGEVAERKHRAHLPPSGGNQPWINGGGSTGASPTVSASGVRVDASFAASRLRAWISPSGSPVSIRSPIFGRKTIPTAGATWSPFRP